MKTVVVTGGSKGIGRACARALAKQGFAVVINFASSVAAADAAVLEIEAAGGAATAVRADVAAREEVQALFETAKQTYGGIDAVVACAGVMTSCWLAEASDADFDRQFQVNVRGTFNAFREAARHLRDRGRLIGFSSTTLALNAPGYAIYNATKGAVEGMVRVVAKELASRHITVNAVAPGPVETELFLRGKSDADVARMAGMTPMARLGQPEDIAQVVSFLCSEDAAWVSGQVLRANGGLA